MRARGAKVTDIVILVVAADEGVMPQTVEALNHARAAKVPIIVAINKIDRPEANLDRVKQQLTEQGLIPEDYGGDTITVPVSARTGEGIDKLLEMILLQADVMELKANPDRPARGTVVESQLDRGRGPVATVLIQEGTLHQGDPFVCGVSYGRVRAMLNHLGQRVTEAGPSTPVEIFGLSSVPEPGTPFVGRGRGGQGAPGRGVPPLQAARRRAAEDQPRFARGPEPADAGGRGQGTQGHHQGRRPGLGRGAGRFARALVDQRGQGRGDLTASAGAISETDVTLASASKAIIIGFNVRPEPKAAQLAEKEGVDIRLYTVIYEAINDMREAMEGLLAPTYREKSLGRAEVRKTFNVPGGTIAGSMVLDGKITAQTDVHAWCATAAWYGKARSARCAASRTTRAKSAPATNAVSGSRITTTSSPATSIEAFEMETVLRKLDAGAGRDRGSARGREAVSSNHVTNSAGG